MNKTRRERLIIAREKLGLSQKRMAGRLRGFALLLTIPIETYKQWERGDRDIPSIAVLAAELGITKERWRTYKKKNRDIIDKRNREIVEAIRSGATSGKLANQYGISREMIRQIALRNNVSLPNSRIIVEKRHEQQRAVRAKKQIAKQIAEVARNEQLRELVSGGMSIKDAGQALDISRGKMNTLSRKLSLGQLTQHGRWRNQPPA